MLKRDSTTSMGKSSTQLGPYRATRLWNDVIRTFRAGMPTGRHRRQLRTYDDCFVATEAVHWLHSHLTRDPNFGSEVTRAQTVQLLHKFMKAKVFTDVRGSKNSRDEFDDNGKLYRFMASSPLKPIRTPLAARNVNGDGSGPVMRPAKIDYEKLKPVTCIPEEGVPRCEVITQRMLSAGEIEQEYKTITLNGIKKCLGLSSLNEILDNEWVKGKNIMHNLNYVAKSGYVTNIDKKDQLPTWVLSAMRCLANWPHRMDENIPDYPGFEKDVFKVVQDYFQKLREPLLTYATYDLITNVLVKIEAASKQPPPQRGPSGSQQYASVTSIPPMFASAENLMMDMTMNNNEPVQRGKCKLSPIYAEWDRMLYGGNSTTSLRPPSKESGVDIVYDDDMDYFQRSERSLQSSRRSNDTYTVYKPRALSADLGYSSSYSSHASPLVNHGQSVKNIHNNSRTSSNNNYNTKPKYTIVRLDSRGNLLDTNLQNSSDDANQSNHSNSLNSSPNYSNLNASQKFASMHDIHEATEPPPNLVESHKFYSTNDLNNAQQFLNSSLKNKSPCYGSSLSTMNDQCESGSLLTIPQTDQSQDRSLPQYISPPSYNAGHRPVINGAFRRQTSSSSTASYKTAPSQNNSTGLTSYNSARSMNNESRRSMSRQVSSNALRNSLQNLNNSMPRQHSANAAVNVSGSSIGKDNSSNANRNYSSSQSINNNSPHHVDMTRQGSSNNLRSPHLYNSLTKDGGCHDHNNSNHGNSSNRSNHSPNPQNLSANRYDSHSSNMTNFSSTPILRENESRLSRYISSTSLFSSDAELKVESALQLCCLLLPPGNRRKLHLLLRLLNKMSSNDSLTGLDKSTSVRTLVLQTFSRCILRCQEEADLDELLALRLVSFMIDHYEAIMKVPTDLKTQIEDKLVYLRRAKIRYSTDDIIPIAYCEQVTTAEFEAQSMTSSQTALHGLLDTIVNDKRMGEKDRKKKLKMFQKTYPEIFNKRFPPGHEVHRPKIKQPLLARPLQKLRTLRL